MKTMIDCLKKVALIAMLLFSVNLFAQKSGVKKTKQILGVLNIDTKGLQMQPDQMGNLVRIELDKLDTFDVIDRYDAMYLIEKNNINIKNCYGKICLVENGKLLQAEKMLGGSVELIGETMIVTLKLIDVNTSSTEKTQVKEFLNLPNEMQSMIMITMREMFELKNNEELVTRLTKKFNYENLVNNPDQSVLKLNGPRLGFIIYTDDNAAFVKARRNEGGFSAVPIMFQFGYQFEKQYLNEGSFQALFEFLPMITGLDQGLIIPSVTILHGLRNNQWGWEFAFGPTFSVNRFSKGYYNEGHWTIPSDSNYIGTHPDIYERLDSRGDAKFSTGFIFAFGKTFKSGKLNIPVNCWLRPDKNGMMFGASFGFNAKRKKV